VLIVKRPTQGGGSMHFRKLFKTSKVNFLSLANSFAKVHFSSFWGVQSIRKSLQRHTSEDHASRQVLKGVR
jgi:hypothetical protein